MLNYNLSVSLQGAVTEHRRRTSLDSGPVDQGRGSNETVVQKKEEGRVFQALSFSALASTRGCQVKYSKTQFKKKVI